MVDRILPVIGVPAADANLIAWLDVSSAPIRLDPHWNNGDYYGKEPPMAGLAQALMVVTLHANHWDWANATFGRKWAKEGEDPNASLANEYMAVAALRAAGAARAKTSDANHLLYLAKANQTFVAGGGNSLQDALAKLKTPTLLITSPKDLVFHKTGVRRLRGGDEGRRQPRAAHRAGGDRGHLDGVLSIKQAEAEIRAFVDR